MFLELNGQEADTRQGVPRVAMIHLHKPFLSPKVIEKTVYCLIGTDYGHIHTSGGDVRTWATRSGAAQWLKHNY